MAKKQASSQAPEVVQQLVAKFAEHHQQYKRGDYNETQLRRDFLDPFIGAMGWDLDNRKGYSEKFREVIHEDAIRVEQSVKVPDYCFRIGGQRQYLVEAKISPFIKLESICILTNTRGLCVGNQI